jgi:transcriptional regulator with XRE-family HTH domain
MKLSKAMQNAEQEARNRDSSWIGAAKLDFALKLEACRRNTRLSYKQMADLMGTSAAYITKIFRGDANLTIDSMVRLARSTGGELKIEITHPAIATATAPSAWANITQLRPGNAANSKYKATPTTETQSPYDPDQREIRAA